MMVSGCTGNSLRTAYAIALLIQRVCRWIGGRDESRQIGSRVEAIIKRYVSRRKLAEDAARRLPNGWRTSRAHAGPTSVGPGTSV
jgi:hypothetical protein